MLSTEEYFKLVKDSFIEYELAKSNDEIISVWYSKNIQNHKGMFIIKNEQGVKDFYFECTYNGDNKEFYIDAYLKVSKFQIEVKESN